MRDIKRELVQIRVLYNCDERTEHQKKCLKKEFLKDTLGFAVLRH